MPRLGDTNSGGQKWHPAPYQSAPSHTGSIQGIWLDEGDEIDWHWMHTLAGDSYVNGYTLKKKPVADVFKPIEEKTDEED